MKITKNKIIVMISVVAVVGLIWFGGKSSREQNGGFSPSPHGQSGLNQTIQTASASESVALNDLEQIDFTLNKLDGEPLTLSDYKGIKPVVLDFFATWCPNCRRDMPRLSKLYEEYGDQIEVIGINLQERKSTVEKYISSTNILFPIVLDPRSEVARQFGVQYTNFHVLISKEGVIVGTVPGDINESQLLSLIQ